MTTWTEMSIIYCKSSELTINYHGWPAKLENYFFSTWPAKKAEKVVGFALMVLSVVEWINSLWTDQHIQIIVLLKPPHESSYRTLTSFASTTADYRQPQETWAAASLLSVRCSHIATHCCILRSTNAPADGASVSHHGLTCSKLGYANQ